MIGESKVGNAIPESRGLYGLIMCGGNSQRMGTDKSMLAYYGKPQSYYLYEMLRPFCEKVFISCNEKQVAAIDAGYQILTDLPCYKGIGPMAGLLTAFSHYPKNDFIIIGCDYPFLTGTELAGFISMCKKEKVAAFFNRKENLYEPLLAFYPSDTGDMLKEMHASQQYSLQYFLRMNDAAKYHPVDERSMISVDTSEDHVNTISMINKPVVEI